jgi:hypothetical protein
MLEYSRIFLNEWTRALLDVTDRRVDPSIAVTTLDATSIHADAVMGPCGRD